MTSPYQDIMSNANFSVDDWKTLWCQCAENNSRIHFGRHLEETLQPLHDVAWIQGLIYVCVTLSLYATGLMLIAFRSGSDCDSIFLLIYSCCSTFSCSRSKDRNHRLTQRSQKSSIRSTQESWYDTLPTVAETETSEKFTDKTDK